MSETQIHYQLESRIARLTLDNPSKRNALNPILLQQLLDRFEQIEKEDSARVVILCGAGDRAFCSGYDIHQLPDGTTGAFDPSLFDRAMKRLTEFPLPTIAMLNGDAIGGGGELAMSADMRIGRVGMKFMMPPARLGVVYSADGFRKFINAIGMSRTRMMFFGALPIESGKALAWGLLDEQVRAEALESTTRQIAAEIALGAPIALKGMKRVTGMLARPTLTDADRNEELRLRLESFTSADFKEGKRAFMEKRTPCFQGK